MERYRELNKDMERLQEWRQNHIDVRETFIQTTARLAHRRRQLISELNLIYPIHQVCKLYNQININTCFIMLFIFESILYFTGIRWKIQNQQCLFT